MQPEAATKEERQPRHVELFGAISNDLSHAVGKLEALRNEISGSEAPSASGAADAPPPPTPAPADVYSGAPGEIMDFSERICNLTTEIRNMVA